MIKCKEDYLRYLEEDRKALAINRKKPKFFSDEIWKFERLLRKLEYINNCKGVLYKPYFYFTKYRYKKISMKLGFTIPINICEEGLSIAHQGTIVINNKAKIGKNCRIHVDVNIGGFLDDAPIIGNNVYIAPGVKMFGKIQIADGIKIGANAVVNRSFLEPNTTIVGVPAKKVIKNV
ncbi:serine O-acetyltransferase [Candidatus Clostridium radicumherbarum]|uniref:Serine O-acetyltransferase n=1 Tax=Candidatus Clostridium radicumherbarum TaxID=3381662 RepID=A0ABW8TUI9_9CLOT